MRSGRTLVVGIAILYLGAGAIGAMTQGQVNIWSKFGVPTLSPVFADMRGVTAGWECARRDIDVLVSNPCNPTGARINYPRLWVAPAYLGLGSGSTVALSLIAIGVFFVALIAALGRPDVVGGLTYVAMLLSPSVMLVAERGNNDLLVFALIVWSCLLMSKRSGLLQAGGSFLLSFSAMLKLYPVFATPAVVGRLRRSAVLRDLLIVIVPFGFFVGLSWLDLQLIDKATPHPIWPAYGLQIALDVVQESTLISEIGPGRPASGQLFASRWDPGVYLGAAAILCAFGVLLSRFVPAPKVGESFLPAMNLLRAGAGIFVGTYLVGYNFDYKLIFLLLTVPFLLDHVRLEKAWRIWSMTLLSLYITLVWSSRFAFHVWFLLDEVVAAGVFIGLFAILTKSLSWSPSDPAPEHSRAPSND